MEALHLTKSNLNGLQYCVNRAYIKIFHVSDNASISWCQFYSHQLPIEMLCDLHKLVYFNKLSQTKCNLLTHVFNICAVKQRLNLHEKYAFFGKYLNRNAWLKIMFDKVFNSLKG